MSSATRLFSVASGNGLLVVSGLCTGVIAARALGPASRGDLFTIQAWAGFVAVFGTLGLTQSMVSFKGDGNRLAGGALGSLLFGATTGLIVFLLISNQSDGWLTATGIAGGCLIVVGGILSSFAAARAQRSGQMIGVFQLVRLAPVLAALLAMSVLWYLGIRDVNLWSLIVGFSILLATLIAGRRSMLNNFERLLGGTIRWPDRALFADSARAWAVSMASQMIYRADVLAVTLVLSSTQAGLYAVAVAAGGAAFAFSQTGGMLAFSDIARTSPQGDHHGVLRRALIWTVLLSCVVAALAGLAAPWVISLFFGAAFADALPAALLLIVASVPMAADYLLIHALQAMGRGSAVLRIQIVVVVVTLSMLVIVIPFSNIMWIASVSIATYTVSAIALAYLGLARRPALGR